MAWALTVRAEQGEVRGEKATGVREGAGSVGHYNALEDILVNMHAEVAGLVMTGQNTIHGPDNQGRLMERARWWGKDQNRDL